MNMMEMMVNKIFGNNPAFKRAQEMATGKSEKEIQQIAINLCKEKGIDINKAYSEFQKQFCEILQNMK